MGSSWARRGLLVGLAGCSTSLDLKNYATDCDADTQCVRVVVGDICSCACDLAAINARDLDRYGNDLENIGACRTNCVMGDAGFMCGVGIGAQCTNGRCATYVLPPDAGVE